MTDRDTLQPPSEHLGWAIVGLGDFACNQILPAFAACARSKVTALVSGDRAKAHQLAHQYGVPEEGVYTYDTFDQLRDNPAVDVVYIILPNALHGEYSIRAAQAGKHVFCEKPMAPTSAECEAMIAACEGAGRTLGIAYRAHFEAHNVEAHRLLREGAIGDLKLIVADHARILDPAKKHDQWRTRRDLAGGGSLVDIGIYSLNAARWFAGEEPAGVSAALWSTPGDPRFAEVEETISFTLRFPSGVIANCSSSYGCARAKRYRLFGSAGWLDLDPATEYHGNRLVIGRETGREERTVQPGNQFAAEIDHFSACVEEGREPAISGAMGLQDVRIIEAIYRAAESGQLVALL
jgi:predicted dehydrogenase